MVCGRKYPATYGTEGRRSLVLLMKHYVIEQWVDFSRGLIAGPERERMRAHLAGKGDAV